MAELKQLRASYSVAISELRKAPMKVIEAADGDAVAILNHNAPVAYVVSPKMMGDLLELAADQLSQQRALERLPTLKKAKAVSLTDL
ncbi:MAG: type II toxin-antitoxin system Phd/YefM family antitoxin [Betaproteobacteria bacterium]|nr:type II toxin-antitoxin system Phd/YefM family antitoxin [Betaproteobacteria bacterium]